MPNYASLFKEGITPAQALENLKERVKALPDPFQQAAVIGTYLPELLEDTMEQAQNAFQGLTLLPGNPGLSFIGNPPDWKGDPYHNQEYVFQISRMNHWLPMLYAYYITGEKRYPKKILEELLSWITICPGESLYDENQNPRTDYFNSPKAGQWRVLECGIRPYRTWCPVLEGLCLADVLTEETFIRILESLRDQCEVVSLISPLAWPKADHNHYLMENLGLLAVSCLLPELKKAEQWKAQAIQGMSAAMNAQVAEDGAQIEGCPSYHNGCVFWFAMALSYGKRYGFSFPKAYVDRFSRMINYSIYATRPCGTNVPWGDTGTLTGNLTKGAVCTYLGTGDASGLFVSRNFYSYEALLTEAQEQVWRVAQPEEFCRFILEAKARTEAPRLPLLHISAGLKQAFLRTGWGAKDLSVMFACRTPVQNLHAHIDPCGFDFTAYGVPMVVDPGRYTYQEGEYRKNFKSMLWHNTLTINDRNAWEYLGSWSYGPQREGSVTGSGETAHLQWIMASHDNYHPVRHARCIALASFSGLRFLLVIDRLEHLQPDDTMQLQFHVDRPAVTLTEDGAEARWDAQAGIRILSTMGIPSTLPAKVSDKNDVFRDSTILQYRGSRTAETETIASILYPVEGEDSFPAIALTAAAAGTHGSKVTVQINGICCRLQITEHCIKETAYDEA